MMIMMMLMTLYLKMPQVRKSPNPGQVIIKMGEDSFTYFSIKVFDDSLARGDWGWQHKIGLEQLVDIMITNLRWSAPKISIQSG